MKGIFLKLTVALCALCCTAGLAACKKGAGGNTVTFHLNYQNAPQAQVVEIDDNGKVQKPQDPTREGYEFEGWYLNIAGTESFDFDNSVDGSVRIFAKWKQTKATVIFDCDNGKTESVTADVGGKVDEPEAPTKDGFIFGGWCTDAAGRHEFDFAKPVMGDITLYASWLQTHATVTFVLYDDNKQTETVELNNTVVWNGENPERGDYAFTGWYADILCRTEYDFNKPVKKNITIYAGWKMTVANVSLNGNYPNAPTPETVKATMDECMTQPDAITRQGYEFIGWYKDEGCENAFDFNAEKVTGNLILYAGWKVREYTVIFTMGAQGSNETFDMQKIKFGEIAVIPENDPEVSGYTFTGWYSAATGGTPFDFDSAITDDTTVYAQWTKSSSSGSHIVSFYLNDVAGGGSVYEELEVKSGRRVTAPKAPTREAKYYFVGWSLKSDGNSYDLFNFSSTTITAPTKLYAVWYKKHTFEAEYVNLTTSDNGGPKPGQGTSDNPNGLGLIMGVADKKNGNDLGLSNGYCVGDLYYNGANLEFKINSSAAVTDATVILRVTSEFVDYNLSDNEYQVFVNGSRLEYGTLNITGAIPNAEDGQNNLAPFRDIVLKGKISLNAGENTIKLVTNNSNSHLGTYQAETPILDCIYICTSADLEWYECHPENVKQKPEDVNVW